MKRSRLAVTAAVVASAGLMLTTLVLRPRTPPPNILIILSDDQDAASMQVMTKVNALWAAQGVTFTNFFAGDPNCCPGRAQIMTGQNAHNHLVWLSAAPGGWLSVDPTSLLSNWLQAAGYKTGWEGKFFNGYGIDDHPAVPPAMPCKEVPPGFNEFWAFVGQPAYNNYVVNANGSVIRFGSAQLPPGCTGSTQQSNVYSTDRLAQRAENWIGAQAGTGQPWVLVVAPYAPHQIDVAIPPQPAARHAGTFSGAPFPTAASYNEADVSDKPAFIQAMPLLTATDTTLRADFHRKRWESLLAVDDLVERLETKLISTGQAANTVRIYTSDNGYANGEHRLKGWKYVAYEESVKVPFVVRGPSYPAGLLRSELVGQLDIAPTLVVLAGATATRVMDGQDLGPLLRGESPPWRSALLLESRFASFHDAIRRADGAVYIEHQSGERELYFLAGNPCAPPDPDQLGSRHADAVCAAEMSLLAGQLAPLKTCSGATCWVP